MAESKAQHEVSDPGHETAQDQNNQRPHSEQHQKQADQSEGDNIPAAEIDEAGPEAAGDCGVAAPFQDPALQGNDQYDHQQGDTCKYRRFSVIGNRVSDQRKDFCGIDIETKGYSQQVFGFKGLENAQQLQREDQNHR